MRLLLDTHIWLWGHLEPHRLSPAVAQALNSPKHELWLSSVSVWEFLLLVDRGRISIDGNPDEWVDAALALAPLRDAPVSREIAKRSRVISVPTQDPADRFIAATAEILELTLVTGDQNLLSGRGYRTMANG